MDHSLRIQIILQINMTREEKNGLDFPTQQTELDVSETPGCAVRIAHA